MGVADPNCFGFFGGARNTSCDGCFAIKRCKAVLVSHGFDILGATVDHLVSQLPDNADYRDTDRVSEIVSQLREPPPPLAQEEQDILGLLDSEKTPPIVDDYSTYLD